MAALPSVAHASALQPPQPTRHAFRLGDESGSDASDSEDDQSVASEHHLSVAPSSTSGQPTAVGITHSETKSTRSARRRKNKQARKEIGALQENLETVLDHAFSAPDPPAATSEFR